MHRGDIDLGRLTLLSPPFLHATKRNVSRFENKLINVKIEAFSARRMHSRSKGTAFEAEKRLLPQWVCYTVRFHLRLGIPNGLFPPRSRTIFHCTSFQTAPLSPPFCTLLEYGKFFNDYFRINTLLQNTVLRH